MFKSLSKGQDSMEPSLMSHTHDRYCGGFLSAENDAESGASVFARIQGNVFWMQLVTGRRRNETEFDQTLHGPGRVGNGVSDSNVNGYEIK